MKIKFLGTGSAFTVKNWNANMLVMQNGKNLLIDCGGDVRHALTGIGMSYRDVDAIYVSHLHDDHAQGLGYFGFCTHFDPTFKEKITLYGNGDLLRRGWESAWKGNLESKQGSIMSLDAYFDVNMVRPNGTFIWEGIEFTVVQAMHIMNGFVFVPAFGLIANDEKSGRTVFFTTDTQFCPNQIKDFYKMADLIVHDCETAHKSGVHSHYDELRTLDAEIKSKMLLIHYQDNILEPYNPFGDGLLEAFVKDPKSVPVRVPSFRVSKEWDDKAKTDGFRGFTKTGLVYDVDTLLWDDEK